MAEWDAAKYHRISDPQLAWGRAVAARLDPAPGERILDLGCGTGRLTTELAETPDVVIVGVDRSAAMLAEANARRSAARAPSYVLGDAAALPFTAAFDAVFSNATLHWVKDHDRLFQSIHGVLRPGGRLVAQCGGAGNLRQLYGRARLLMTDPAYVRFFDGWQDPWRFEGADPTRARLEAAGFVDIDVTVTPAPTRFEEAGKFAEFIASVCLRHELDRLPPELRDPFVDRLTAQAGADAPPLTLDYWRLNIGARKRSS